MSYPRAAFFRDQRGPKIRVAIRYTRDPWLPAPRRRHRMVQAARQALAAIKRASR